MGVFFVVYQVDYYLRFFFFFFGSDTYVEGFRKADCYSLPMGYRYIQHKSP